MLICRLLDTFQTLMYCTGWRKAGSCKLYVITVLTRVIVPFRNQIMMAKCLHHILSSPAFTKALSSSQTHFKDKFTTSAHACCLLSRNMTYWFRYLSKTKQSTYILIELLDIYVYAMVTRLTALKFWLFLTELLFHSGNHRTVSYNSVELIWKAITQRQSVYYHEICHTDSNIYKTTKNTMS